MSKKDKALKLSLEALETEHSAVYGTSRTARAITAVREALAEQPAQQPYDTHAAPGQSFDTHSRTPLTQQEPVAYIRKDQLQKAAQSPMLCEVTPEPRQDRISIYTSPPASKPWVGLDDADLAVCDTDGVRLARYWERVLREKNA